MDRRDEFAAGHGRSAPHRRAVGELRLCAATRARRRRNCRSSIPRCPACCCCPIQFPDYNNIDSIDSENVIRFGLRNTLQTKRDGQLDNLLDWNRDARLAADNLDEPGQQHTFNDLYSDLAFRRARGSRWSRRLRYNINNGNLNFAYPPDHIHAQRTVELGPGPLVSARRVSRTAATISSAARCFSGSNDNWGFRAEHDFNAMNGRLQEQFYTIYRDLRSWTGAMTFRVTDNGTGPQDFTVAFSFSIKAHPRHARSAATPSSRITSSGNNSQTASRDRQGRC